MRYYEFLPMKKKTVNGVNQWEVDKSEEKKKCSLKDLGKALRLNKVTINDQLKNPYSSAHVIYYDDNLEEDFDSMESLRLRTAYMKGYIDGIREKGKML